MLAFFHIKYLKACDPSADFYISRNNHLTKEDELIWWMRPHIESFVPLAVSIGNVTRSLDQRSVMRIQKNDGYVFVGPKHDAGVFFRNILTTDFRRVLYDENKDDDKPFFLKMSFQQSETVRTNS